jgi:nucleotide-binding universal stress UspA family protein
MYKTIFAYLPSAKSAALLSGVAADLAARHQARVIGAHNSAKFMIYGGIPEDFEALHAQEQRQRADAIEKSFTEATAARGVQAVWRHKAMTDTDAFADIVAAARSADLIVAGGAGEDDPLGHWYDLPIRLVLETGRPVLLVPAQHGEVVFGARVTVAWNHSREAARAAFDALPLLMGAKSVRVLAINSTVVGTENPSDDLAAALAEHGVKAEAAAIATGRSEAEELLEEAARSHSDLLVMGCYGHSRWREMVLGGATRYVLDNMRTPVLMAH